jgi:hypothetical protein
MKDDGSISNSGKFKAAITEELSKYFEKLRKGEGEDGEGLNIVHLENPFRHKDKTAISVGDELGIPASDPKKFRTSWNTQSDPHFSNEGRVGYSVKFVSFKSLTGAKTSSNGTSSWGNDLDPKDDEIREDFKRLSH